jgi:hypothetical protein
MARYKSHYACFKCRKTFKRRLMFDINKDDKRPEVLAKCPQCNELMANMGYDFAAPKMKAEKEWAHLKTLYSVGIAFHSCGCTGPGYIPADKQALKEYFHGILDGYHQQLSFWRNRVVPNTQPEIDREKSLYGNNLAKLPGGYTNKKKSTLKNDDAIAFWIDKVKTVEAKLKLIE